jgi:hypothetical protein
MGVRRESGRMEQMAINFHLSIFRLYDCLCSWHCSQSFVIGYFVYDLNWIFILTFWFRMDSVWFHEFKFFIENYLLDRPLYSRARGLIPQASTPNPTRCMTVLEQLIHQERDDSMTF